MLGISEMESEDFHFEVVKRSIAKSFDRGDRERELTSKLLSWSYPNLLTSNDIGKGFMRLLEHMDSYMIDVPLASHYTSSFLSRAVIDEVLPPSFLRDEMVRSIGGDVIEDSVRMLTREHCGVRLERVWGPGDGRPVADLKVAMDQLLKEYLLSKDLDEACNCVRELNSPHFHHELIKRGIKISIDGTDDDLKSMSDLFAFLHHNEILSSTQIRKGLDRCYNLLPDFILDCPKAATKLDYFKAESVRNGFVGAEYKPPVIENGAAAGS